MGVNDKTAHGINYIITRQRRKTTAIHIRNGEVEVRAPLTMPKSQIDSFVAEKQSWILRHLKAEQARQKQKQQFRVDYGSLQLWRGMRLPILANNATNNTATAATSNSPASATTSNPVGATCGRPRNAANNVASSTADNAASGMTNNTSYATSSRAWIDAAGFHLPPELTSDELKASLILLYKKAAKPHLQERVNHFARIMGVSPATIRINSAKTRWGSCSKRTGAATLNFSWRLCLATDEVIDYVVVHELAHIREMNHSAAFYAIVRQVIPNYDELRRQLRLLSRQLACEDWSS